VRGHGLRTAFAFKQRLGLGLYFAPPLTNLDWVDAELQRYLVNCLHTAYRFKTHLGLEFRQVCVALLRFTHDLPVSLDSVPLKHLSQIRGPLHPNWQRTSLKPPLTYEPFGLPHPGIATGRPQTQQVQVREDGVVGNEAIYQTLGLRHDGTRDILGL
jgi:hypothetical protein